MSKNNTQSPNAVVMVRPHFFTPNPQTAGDNMFQTTVSADEKSHIAKAAYDEVSRAAVLLDDEGVRVHLFEDETKHTPDSVFPNNWFSTHSDGTVVTYPMYAQNRRQERRSDIIEMLKTRYQVDRLLDYAHYEADDAFLEGTGAMVLDHTTRMAYVVRSHRAHIDVLRQFCVDVGYESMMFDACDADGVPVYHTNVMMCIASHFALIGLDMMRKADEREAVQEKILKSGRELIQLSEQQVRQFSGNAFELHGKDGNLLALSQTAYDALTKKQRALIRQTCKILSIDVSTIEMAGGSLRCMLAGIHLQEKT